jgi:hypothetical protein
VAEEFQPALKAWSWLRLLGRMNKELGVAPLDISGWDAGMIHDLLEVQSAWWEREEYNARYA